MMKRGAGLLFSWLGILILLAFWTPVQAQEEALSEQISTIPRTSSDEVMQRPAELTDEAGNLHQKVTTSSDEAQAYYDQVVSYLHSYVWVEAARSFHEALRRDSGLAMAHLGLAKACTGAAAYKDAFTHLEKAAEIAEQGNLMEKEERWVALGREQLDGIFSAPDERPKRLQAYRQAIDELITLAPDDAHAWVLRGNAEERSLAGRGQGGQVGSVVYYAAALKRDPEHFEALIALGRIDEAKEAHERMKKYFE
jgi:tetratricopeptide (TPR) repeat protein